jgi:HTH-type transcriptional regulator / antitoxin HigA
MPEYALAEVFPPGEYLDDELKARGWSQSEFADIIGRTPSVVSQLISGKRVITPELAKEIGAAFGTGPEVWMNLESAYRLGTSEPAPSRIERRARLTTRGPVREMILRKWINDSDNVDVLETAVLRHYRIERLEDRAALAFAAKQTVYGKTLTGAQEAWLMRVKNIADTMPAPLYSDGKLRRALEQMRSLLSAPDEVRHVPGLLNEAGVRFVIVEQLPGLKIDGVCFWLDDNKPVIGMSMRFDRIDNFWFVLRHEIEHVLNRDGTVLDIDLEGTTAELPEEEVLANEAAADFCVPPHEMRDFMDRKGPLYNEDKIRRFARSIQLHPGLVAGQLRHRLGRHDLFGSLLAKVRPAILGTALVDGFGYTLEVNL